MAKREPIFNRGGLIVIVSFAMTFAIMAGARMMGYESSALGFLGVLIATHVVTGVTMVIRAWQERQAADFAMQAHLSQWRLSQPDPFDQDDYSGPTELPAPSAKHPPDH